MCIFLTPHVFNMTSKAISNVSLVQIRLTTNEWGGDLQRVRYFYQALLIGNINIRLKYSYVK